MNILLILAKDSLKQKLNFSRNALFHMKTRVSVKYFVNSCRSSVTCKCFYDAAIILFIFLPFTIKVTTCQIFCVGLMHNK